jgi:hypothetical protein
MTVSLRSPGAIKLFVEDLERSRFASPSDLN